MPVITVQISTRTKDQVNQPILYRIGKDFNVVTNIRRAQVTEDYGFVEVDIEGTLEEVQRAISWLHTTGLHIEAKQRSVSDESNL
jgi:ABC-type methionine transport system ATPase subunit